MCDRQPRCRSLRNKLICTAWPVPRSPRVVGGVLATVRRQEAKVPCKNPLWGVFGSLDGREWQNRVRDVGDMPMFSIKRQVTRSTRTTGEDSMGGKWQRQSRETISSTLGVRKSLDRAQRHPSLSLSVHVKSLHKNLGWGSDV